MAPPETEIDGEVVQLIDRAPGGMPANGTGGVRVIVADSSDIDRRPVARHLLAHGFRVHEVASGREAVDLVRTRQFAALLCDQWMPGLNGMEVVDRVLEADPDIAIVVQSRVNDAKTTAEMLGKGAFDYLLKPSDPLEVVAAIERAVDRRSRGLERRRLENSVRETVILRTIQIEKEKAALRRAPLEMVHSLIRVLEAKDPYLRGHSERVATLAARIADELRMSFDQVESIRLAATLHDVGMIGVPDAILNKPAPLTEKEFAVVKRHVEIGMGILEPVSFIGDAMTFVRDHHEHFDGSGYPRGLAGEAISLGGRVLAAADAFDALTSSRAFRKAYAPADALETLSGVSGSLLDPQVFRALKQVATRSRGSFTLL